MAFFDLPLDQLQNYRPSVYEPSDFDAFWAQTLSEVRRHPLNAVFEPVDYGLRTVETFDVTFSGYAGQPIKGWFIIPAHRTEPLPCVVEFIGYGGGRSFATDWLLWASMGYAHLVMDTRGQGTTWSPGSTPDPEADGSNPHYPGFMTRGILNPKSYYYRRVFSDAVRAIETAQSNPVVDAGRIATTGGSQGGGIALAASGLSSAVSVVMPDVPFLCYYQRATEITASFPYEEISQYCKTHRDKVDAVFNNLGYFDGVNFAKRANAQALFSVGLMDEICPPSTVYAAYNHFKGTDKQMSVWRYNHHEGGGTYQNLEKTKFLRGIWG